MAPLEGKEKKTLCDQVIIVYLNIAPGRSYHFRSQDLCPEFPLVYPLLSLDSVQVIFDVSSINVPFEKMTKIGMGLMGVSKKDRQKKWLSSSSQ